MTGIGNVVGVPSGVAALRVSDASGGKRLAPRLPVRMDGGSSLGGTLDGVEELSCADLFYASDLVARLSC